MMRLALFFYGACSAVAIVWGLLAHHHPLLLLRPASLTDAGLGAAAGLGLGLSVVALSRLLARWSSWARELLDWFAGLLGPVTAGQAVSLAALSAVGEELLFRGAMQPSLGLWITSLIFALLHFPQRLRLWPWTVSAGLLGLGFGSIARRSAHLGGPLVAHFVINAMNLAQVGRRALPMAGSEKLPADGVTPSIEDHEEPGALSPPGQSARRSAGEPRGDGNSSGR